MKSHHVPELTFDKSEGDVGWFVGHVLEHKNSGSKTWCFESYSEVSGSRTSVLGSRTPILVSRISILGLGIRGQGEQVNLDSTSNQSNLVL